MDKLSSTKKSIKKILSFAQKNLNDSDFDLLKEDCKHIMSLKFDTEYELLHELGSSIGKWCGNNVNDDWQKEIFTEYVKLANKLIHNESS